MPNDHSNTSQPSQASEDLNSASNVPWVLNAQTRSPDRPSLKYSNGGSGPLWKKDEAFCLPTSGQSGQFIVSASLRSTSTPSKSTSDISPYTPTMETSPKSTLKLFPTSTSSSAASLARRLVSQVFVKGLQTREVRSFLTSLGFFMHDALSTLYWKTSKGFFLMTTDELSRPSSPRL